MIWGRLRARMSSADLDPSTLQSDAAESHALPKMSWPGPMICGCAATAVKAELAGKLSIARIWLFEMGGACVPPYVGGC